MNFSCNSVINKLDKRSETVSDVKAYVLQFIVIYQANIIPGAFTSEVKWQLLGNKNVHGLHLGKHVTSYEYLNIL